MNLWFYEYPETDHEFSDFDVEASGVILVVGGEEEGPNRKNIGQKMEGLIRLKHKCNKLEIYLINKEGNGKRLQ